ncbi:MAG: bifunctional phosphopantothenoylcysteine decarboxylase/phosphopantothenate--cysteine ligase CoaBC [Thermoplasmata archaeon]|nr:bifunctional phosphopantothenoylcysteine decarboxylase/phosphopantothenate--cysteine ligase CoaBC [Thermoplasmata archaeon]
MHPSHVIRGRTTELLAGRRILVGVSGSIAAVEVPKIIRELIRHGADVRAVMSPEATRIVTAEALEFATGHPAIVQLTGNVEHVTLLGPGEGRADLYLIAPATANTISKIAHGIDDTPVTSFASVALGGGVPLLIAPAMHEHMGLNPAVRESIDKLRSWGVGIVQGASAEGEEKIATPEEVAAAVLHRIARGPWAGRRVLVIGGAARESLDSVRSLTNESSGASAVALASQAFFRGAEVALWTGALQVTVPPYLRPVAWRSVGDLITLARERSPELRAADAVFVPAALSDFVVDRRPGKIRSAEQATLSVTLQLAPKVLPELRRLSPRPAVLVAFKLLAGDSAARLEEEGRRLRKDTGADWVVANDVATMGSTDTNALILPPKGPKFWIRASKPVFAGRLLDEIGRELAGPASTTRAAPTKGSSRPHRSIPARSNRGPGRRSPRRAPAGPSRPD